MASLLEIEKKQNKWNNVTNVKAWLISQPMGFVFKTKFPLF